MTTMPTMMRGVAASVITAASVALAGCVTSSNRSDVTTYKENNAMTTWSHVTVGVADLDKATALWVDTFGFEVLGRKEGADASLAQLWSLSAEDIARQALVGTPAQQAGRIHLVQFANPLPAVRDGAQVFDLCPKNLDIHARDLPARVAELKAAGVRFRTDTYSTVTAPNGVTFREIHMPAHDDINVVLLEVIGEDLPYTERGYAGVGPLISIVPDAAREVRFYQQVLGLEAFSHNVLKGPEIERLIGLPPGAALDISILGRADEHFGQIELVDYQGVEGRDLYPRAVPKARGILMVTYQVAELAPLTTALNNADVEFTPFDNARTLAGDGNGIVFYSPAGLRIQAQKVFAP